MNRRIVKAARRNNEFQLEWMIAERLLRVSDSIYNSAGLDMQKDLINRWLKARKAWC